ncbi:MAG: hypothetical protein M1823_003326 [Watsoniomyces obsoletus]|nr:MAG: hypothetical protein M1823_003326 [Watsoniomyces obsoletus]
MAARSALPAGYFIGGYGSGEGIVSWAARPAPRRGGREAGAGRPAWRLGPRRMMHAVTGPFRSVRASIPPDLPEGRMSPKSSVRPPLQAPGGWVRVRVAQHLHRGTSPPFAGRPSRPEAPKQRCLSAGKTKQRAGQLESPGRSLWSKHGFPAVMQRSMPSLV